MTKKHGEIPLPDEVMLSKIHSDFSNNPDPDVEEEKLEIDDVDVYSGREIAGLKEKPEHFSSLIEGQDFLIISQNPNVNASRPVQDFFVYVNPSGGNEEKMVKPPHWRTITDEDVFTEVTVTQVIDGFPEDRKIAFFEVNTKGVGYLKPTVRDKSIDDYDTWVKEDSTHSEMLGAKVLGMMSRDSYAKTDYIDQSMMLAGLGLRGEVYWALADLKRVPYKGEMKTIEELKSMGVIIDHQDFKPVEAVRLLRTNTRVEEAYEAEDRRDQIFKDAFETFNKETDFEHADFPRLEIGNEAHQRIFYREFFRRMGENLAVLLNIGYSHSSLHSSNVTMAAEFADVGTMSHWNIDIEKGNEEWAVAHEGVRLSHLKDMRDAAYSLRKLLKAGRLQGLSRGSRENLKKAFFEGFDSILDSSKLGEQDMSIEDVSEWMNKIIDKVLIKRENLPSLLHYELSSWEL